MRDVSRRGAGDPQKERPYDVSRGQNRYVSPFWFKQAIFDPVLIALKSSLTWEIQKHFTLTFLEINGIVSMTQNPSATSR